MTHPPFRGTIAGRARRAWWVHMRRHRGELCQWCGKPYLSWYAPDRLFFRVAIPAGVGLSCLGCFTREARSIGLELIWWPLGVDEWRASADDTFLLDAWRTYPEAWAAFDG